MTALLTLLLLVVAGASCVALAYAVAWPDSPRVLFRGWRCFLRGWHEPRRQPIGGCRCADCGHVGADLGDMGWPTGRA